MFWRCSEPFRHHNMVPVNLTQILTLAFLFPHMSQGPNEEITGLVIML